MLTLNVPSIRARVATLSGCRYTRLFAAWLVVRTVGWVAVVLATQPMPDNALRMVARRTPAGGDPASNIAAEERIGKGTKPAGEDRQRSRGFPPPHASPFSHEAGPLQSSSVRPGSAAPTRPCCDASFAWTSSRSEPIHLTLPGA